MSASDQPSPASGVHSATARLRTAARRTAAARARVRRLRERVRRPPVLLLPGRTRPPRRHVHIRICRPSPHPARIPTTGLTTFRIAGSRMTRSCPASASTRQRRECRARADAPPPAHSRPSVTRRSASQAAGSTTRICCTGAVHAASASACDDEEGSAHTGAAPAYSRTTRAAASTPRGTLCPPRRARPARVVPVREAYARRRDSAPVYAAPSSPSHALALRRLMVVLIFILLVQVRGLEQVLVQQRVLIRIILILRADRAAARRRPPSSRARLAEHIHEALRCSSERFWRGYCPSPSRQTRSARPRTGACPSHPGAVAGRGRMHLWGRE
ncbi:hypothetical protein B0H10DRAFT_831542 [Mycena sp. CBHHK59/15]|nr:hypothetical protein B0H10DRAFT_831542 [Mycena sp. CBHHK59/15]